jgi:hypothetical protein
MDNIEKLLRLRTGAEAMQYLKMHNKDIKKVYSDVNFIGMIQRINQELEFQSLPFRVLTDEEYREVSNIFS